MWRGVSGLGDRWLEFRFSMTEGSFFQRIHTGAGAYPFWFPLGMWPGREADQFPQCSACFRNAWRCAYAVRVCGLVLSLLKPSGYCYVLIGWTFTNSTSCPHIVFMCCVRISEQRAIISLCSVNWLVFVTETEC